MTEKMWCDAVMVLFNLLPSKKVNYQLIKLNIVHGKLHESFKIEVCGLCMVPFNQVLVILGRRVGCVTVTSHLQLQEVGLAQFCENWWLDVAMFLRRMKKFNITMPSLCEEDIPVLLYDRWCSCFSAERWLLLEMSDLCWFLLAQLLSSYTGNLFFYRMQMDISLCTF